MANLKLILLVVIVSSISLYSILISKPAEIIPSHPSLIAFYYRVLCLLLISSTLATIALFPSNINLTVISSDNKLVEMKICGLLTWAPFTVWSFFLMGIYFISTFSPFYRISFVLFEISFSVSILITVIVTFVLIPFGANEKLMMDKMYEIPTLIMHNANVYMMIGELIVYPHSFNLSDFAYIVLYGLVYTIFGWILAYFTKFYFYFFMAPSYKYAVVAHVSLIAALGSFFMIGFSILEFANPKDNFYMGLCLLVAALGICKFTPPPKAVNPKIKETIVKQTRRSKKET